MNVLGPAMEHFLNAIDVHQRMIALIAHDLSFKLRSIICSVAGMLASQEIRCHLSCRGPHHHFTESSRTQSEVSVSSKESVRVAGRAYLGLDAGGRLVNF